MTKLDSRRRLRRLARNASVDGQFEAYADLLKTLEAFIRLHGSVKAVARELFLHRNTVRQRMRRIAQLTGADLGDSHAVSLCTWRSSEGGRSNS